MHYINPLSAIIWGPTAPSWSLMLVKRCKACQVSHFRSKHELPIALNHSTYSALRSEVLTSSADFSARPAVLSDVPSTVWWNTQQVGTQRGHASLHPLRILSTGPKFEKTSCCQHQCLKQAWAGRVLHAWQHCKLNASCSLCSQEAWDNSEIIWIIRH